MSKKRRENKLTNDDMIEHIHGVEALMVDIEVAMCIDEVTACFGERCDEFDPDCPICKGWSQWWNTGKAVVAVDREMVIAMATKPMAMLAVMAVIEKNPVMMQAIEMAMTLPSESTAATLKLHTHDTEGE